MKFRYLALPVLVLAATQSCGSRREPNPNKGSGGGSSTGSATSDGADTSDGFPSDDLAPPTTGGGSGGPGNNLLGLPTGQILDPECASDCTGFSSADGSSPLVVSEEGVNAASLDSAPSGAGPCITEPANGTIFPAAWTRPRFNYPGASGAHKITLSAPKMRHTATFYAAKLPYIMPTEVWDSLSRSVYNEDITYTIKSQSGGETTGTFRVAPVAAGGSMVYWGATGSKAGPTTNALYGFGVGEEGVIRVLYPGDISGVAIDDNANLRVRDYTNTEADKGKSGCVGCHSSTPDGGSVASMDHWAFNLRVYSVEPGTIGDAPDWFSPAGAAMISMTWMGGPVFSKGDWATGARRMVTTWSSRDLSNGNFWKTHDGSVLSGEPTEILWMNLASTGTVPVDLRTATPATYTNQGQGLQQAIFNLKGTDWDELPRTGDPNSPILPDWSHDGKTIVYTSTDTPQDGRVGGAKVVDLYAVPFNGGQGGEAAPVDGAATSDFEYYPDYSPDDALIAFNKVPEFATNPTREDSWDHVYYRPDSEIYVIPSTGGTAMRLDSNDPICDEPAGQLYNSWAKWAPTSATDGQNSYYFLIFSTARNSPFELDRGSGRKSPASQLYMTTVIRHADGSVESSPAIYLWNQRNLVEGTGDAAAVEETLTNNVTPAWDDFLIPPVPPVVIK